MKYLQKFTTLIFLLSLCFSSNAFASVSSIVIDMDSGEILEETNADELRYPASLTKMMTLYMTFQALENGLFRMDDMLPVSRNAANRSPSRIDLRYGQKVKVEDAVKGLIVKSANDCATVLAEAIGYDEKMFANAMTRVAYELGMKNTTFKNASGLPNREQKTTARDMAILAAAIYKHYPQYYELFSLRSFTYNGLTFRTHNTLLKIFEDADGLKTGYTAAAGFNIATSAERDGKRVIAVTMGHRTQKDRDTKIAKMMDTSLNKLLGIKDRASLLAEIPIVKKPDINDAEKGEYLSAENETPEEVFEEAGAGDIWSAKLGSFSNYAKAKKHAKAIKKQNSEEASGKRIEIEIEQVEAAIVYSPKIVGFSKEDANNFCNSLKNSNKSCMVVLSGQLQLAYKK